MIAPVHKFRLITTWMGTAACALVAACSPAEPTQALPPPPAPAEAPPPPLAGGEPPPAYYSPYGPPPRARPVQIVTMNPIANPEDMSPEERAQVYGRGGYGPDYAPDYAERGHWRRHAREYVVHTVHGRRVVTATHPRWAGRAEPQPAYAPPPHGRWVVPHHSMASKPAAQAPTPTPTPTVAAPPAKPATAPGGKLQQLNAAVAQAITQNGQLSVSPGVLQGQAGPVTLTLPANLDDILQMQAAKLGLRRAARQADISAMLTGDGFTITPAGPQTQALTPGHALQFSWQVTPNPNVTGTLQAQVNGALKGQGAPKPLSLGVFQPPPAPAAAAPAPAAESGLHLPSFSHFLAKLQGKDQPDAASAQDNGLHLSGRAQLAIILALLAVVILVLIRKNIVDQQKLETKRRRAREAAHANRDNRPDYTP